MHGRKIPTRCSGPWARHGMVRGLEDGLWKARAPHRPEWYDSPPMIARRLLWPLVMLTWLGPAPSSGVDAHDWYSDLHQPGTGQSCCDGFDCRPLLARQIRYVDGGACGSSSTTSGAMSTPR